MPFFASNDVVVKSVCVFVLQCRSEMKGFFRWLIFVVLLPSFLPAFEHLTCDICEFYEVRCYVMQRYGKSSYVCLFFQPKHKQGSMQRINERMRQESCSTFLINMTGELES